MPKSNSWMSYKTDCRSFNGYKPCDKSANCNDACLSYDKVNTRILLVHLGAMGAVVRSTSLLKSIKRKYPRAHITWVTESPMQNLLEGHPHIDRVILNNPQGHLVLSALTFDVAFIIDKSLTATGILNLTKADFVFGFINDPRTGAIIPATRAADELWQLGLDDEKKFFQNKKPETQLITEACELEYVRDPYHLHLNTNETTEIQKRKEKWIREFSEKTGIIPSGKIIGINTGCGPLMPAKKLSVAFHRTLIQKFLTDFDATIVLLGGPEDTLRNQAIGVGLPVIQTSTDKGIRDGLLSIAACDAILTGDSLGMHMAIALQKEVIAWFGPSCAHEIDLYDRGEKVLTKATCSPCWKRSCQKESMCYDQVSGEEILLKIKTSLMKISNDSSVAIPENKAPRKGLELVTTDIES